MIKPIEELKKENSLEEILDNSNPRVSRSDKKRIYDILESLKEEYEGGTIIVLADEKDIDDYLKKGFYGPMDEDIFEGNPISIYSPEFKEKLGESLQYDGAVIVSVKEDGTAAINSGMGLNVSPVGPECDFASDLKFGARHRSTKKASYDMCEAIFYILSEEYRSIRMIERGDVIYSPVKEEMIDLKKQRQEITELFDLKSEINYGLNNMGKAS